MIIRTPWATLYRYPYGSLLYGMYEWEDRRGCPVFCHKGFSKYFDTPELFPYKDKRHGRLFSSATKKSREQCRIVLSPTYVKGAIKSTYHERNSCWEFPQIERAGLVNGIDVWWWVETR